MQRSTAPSTTSDGATHWEADRPAAVSVLFESQGATTTTSAALDWLLADRARGPTQTTTAVGLVLPVPGQTATPRDAWTGTDAIVEGLGHRGARPLRYRTRRGADAPWCRHLRRRPGTPDASAGAGPRSGTGPVRSHRANSRQPGRHIRRPPTGRPQSPWDSSHSGTSWSVPDGRCSSWRVPTPLERDAVRASDRELSGRPPPSGREPGRPRGGRRPAGRSLGRTPPLSPPPWPRPSPAGRHAPWPGTPSRCWPASASPPSTRCTDPSGGRSSSVSCSAPVAP